MISHFTLPKPGLLLATDDDYAEMIRRACNLTSKDPTINLLVTGTENNVDKENNSENEEVEKLERTRGKKVHTFTFFRMFLIDNSL
jgi:tRNA G46 methylase TrmB